MLIKILKSLSILSFLLLAAVPAQSAVSYTVSELGDFTPLAINNLGEVVEVNLLSVTGRDSCRSL